MKLNDGGWYPYGKHNENCDMLDLAQDYDLDVADVSDILEDVNICCWVGSNDSDKRMAFIRLSAFVGFGTHHADSIILDDLLKTAIDITGAGYEMQMIALQRLQRTVYQAIEETRKQFEERGGPL